MELVRPTLANIWYCGVMKICDGSIIWIRTRENRAFLYLKLSLAKA